MGLREEATYTKPPGAETPTPGANVSETQTTAGSNTQVGRAPDLPPAAQRVGQLDGSAPAVRPVFPRRNGVPRPPGGLQRATHLPESPPAVQRNPNENKDGTRDPKGQPNDTDQVRASGVPEVQDRGTQHDERIPESPAGSSTPAPEPAEQPPVTQVRNRPGWANPTNLFTRNVDLIPHATVILNASAGNPPRQTPSVVTPSHGQEANLTDMGFGSGPPRTGEKETISGGDPEFGLIPPGHRERIRDIEKARSAVLQVTDKEQLAEVNAFFDPQIAEVNANALQYVQGLINALAVEPPEDQWTPTTEEPGNKKRDIIARYTADEFAEIRKGRDALRTLGHGIPTVEVQTVLDPANHFPRSRSAAKNPAPSLEDRGKSGAGIVLTAQKAALVLYPIEGQHPQPEGEIADALRVLVQLPGKLIRHEAEAETGRPEPAKRQLVTETASSQEFERLRRENPYYQRLSDVPRIFTEPRPEKTYGIRIIDDHTWLDPQGNPITLNSGSLYIINALMNKSKSQTIEQLLALGFVTSAAEPARRLRETMRDLRERFATYSGDVEIIQSTGSGKGLRYLLNPEIRFVDERLVPAFKAVREANRNLEPEHPQLGQSLEHSVVATTGLAPDVVRNFLVIDRVAQALDIDLSPEQMPNINDVAGYNSAVFNRIDQAVDSANLTTQEKLVFGMHIGLPPTMNTYKRMGITLKSTIPYERFYRFTQSERHGRDFQSLHDGLFRNNSIEQIQGWFDQAVEKVKLQMTLES
jgi:hypothetical protein